MKILFIAACIICLLVIIGTCKTNARLNRTRKSQEMYEKHFYQQFLLPPGTKIPVRFVGGPGLQPGEENVGYNEGQRGEIVFIPGKGE